MVSLQYTVELAGEAKWPTTPQTVKEPRAVVKARHSRRMTKTARKTAGVSLIAIATPLRAPRHGLREFSSRQSTTTIAVNRRLTWPKLRVSITGSHSRHTQSAHEDHQPGL
ncbi:hypothetical protein HMPREF2781_01100 [Corynebacterium sp. HMSC062A03]|nr:hypothetical protein HMPREF2781_01100 [Corynebacterium sp. HMSC062A03]